MLTHIVDDIAHAREQPGIVQRWFAHSDAVQTELAGFSDQPGGLSHCPHRNWPVVGRHSAELVTGYERCPGAKVRGAERCEHTCWSGADNDDVQHLQPSFYATLLCFKVGEPAQGSQSWHEAIFTASRNDKPQDALKAFANRPPWNCKAATLVATLVVRPGDGILIAARPKKDSVIYPLRLDELELPAEVSADESEHQAPIGAVVLQDSFRERRAICGSAPNHSM